MSEAPRRGRMSKAPRELWILVMPGLPLAVSLAAFLALLSSSRSLEPWGTVILTRVFPWLPLFGVATLAYLGWGWRKGWVELRRPHVVAAVALSLLDIVIPLGLLLYILWALRGARLTF